MKLTCETELMKNQKHANVLGPEGQFDVFQTTNGDSLFFSLGTDGVFYLTREVRQSRTGWARLDLSTVLAANHPGSHISVKSFAVDQNVGTLFVDLALVLNVDQTNVLYTSFNNNITSADDWAQGVVWTPVPFDVTGVAVPIPLSIADVYLMNIPSTTAGMPATQNCFVDIERDESGSLHLLDRYYIQTTSSIKWKSHTLPSSISAGSVHSVLGHRHRDRVPGIYTFGQILNRAELIYTPQYNYFAPDVAPSSARLNLPDQATAIASSLDNTGDTNLFVASPAGLSVFPTDQQHDGANPTIIVPSQIFAGTSSMSAFTNPTRTAVWAVNAQGDLIYAFCTAGRETDPTSWSEPVPLCKGVQAFAFYLNLTASNNVLFAHLHGRQLLQLTQDPLTSIWCERSVLLPSTDVNDMLEYPSFTSHIHVTDDTGIGLPNTTVSLTSTSQVTVYVNDVYHVLMPKVPVEVSTDVSGDITVVQQVSSLFGVCYQIGLDGSVYPVDPTAKAMQRLSSVQTGDDLGKIQISDSEGNSRPLIAPDVSDSDKGSAAKSLAKLLDVKATLPADGSRVQSNSVSVSTTTPGAAATSPVSPWGITFHDQGIQHHEGIPAVQRLLATSVGGSDFISIAAGDFFRFVKSLVDKIDHIVIQAAEGIYSIITKIEDKVYHAVLDCVNAVVGAVEFVLNQIKVFIEEIIMWLGFLFAWPDIVRTHRVVKNILKRYASRVVTEMDTLQSSISDAFDGLEDKLNSLTGIQDIGEKVGSYQAAGVNLPGSSSPQYNWAMHHTKSGGDSADTQVASTPTIVFNAVDQIIKDLEALVTNEAANLEDMVQQIKDQVAVPFRSLTLTEVITRLLGIIGDLILKTAKNVIVKVIDIFKIVIGGFLEVLDAPVNIPIISPLYKAVISRGDELSVLDLICLVGAIPITICFKLAKGRTPYPADDFTQSLIDAPDFPTLAKAMAPPSRNVQQVPTRATFRTLVAQNEPNDLTPYQIAAGTMNILASIGSVLVVFFALDKDVAKDMPTIELSGFYRAGAIASYVLYIAPNITSTFSDAEKWPNVLNDCICLFTIGKTATDNLCDNKTYQKVWSSRVESFSNAVWLLPPLFLYIDNHQPKESDKASLASNLVFDIGGIMAPLASDPRGFIIVQAMTLTYGVLCAACGIEIYQGK